MGYQTDSFRRERNVAIRVQKQFCGKAKAAASIGPIVFVPLLPMVGAVLGFVSLSEMKRNAALTGRRAALFGIGAGVFMTVAQLGAGWVGFRAASDLSEGPRTAVQSGYAGQTERMADWFTSGSVSEAEAAAFVERLRGRYGRLLDIRAETSPVAWRPGEPMSYTIVFERTEAPAKAWFEIAPSVAGQVMKLSSLRIDDRRWGAVALPASAAQLEEPDPANPNLADAVSAAKGG